MAIENEPKNRRLNNERGKIRCYHCRHRTMIASNFSIIATAMEAEAGNWLELARSWLQRQHAGPLSLKDKQKYYRRLVNRGFTHDQAMDACKD